MIAPSNIQTVAIEGGVRITWTDNSFDEHGFEIWRADNGGDYSLIHTTDMGIETYDDTVGTGSYKYKVRAKNGGTLSTSAIKNAPEPLEFVFTSTGNGSGLGIFNLKVNEATTMTIDGTGKFYDDLAGTLNERTQEIFVANILTRVYIKVPSGIATVRIKNVVIEWGLPIGTGDTSGDGWNTSETDPVAGANCPSVSIDVGKMIYNTSINVFGLNTIYGDLSGNSIMTYMEIADGTPNHTTPGHGGATCGGDISNMPLVVFDCWDDTHFTGLCESPDMEIIWTNGLNEVTFNISAMPSLRILVVLSACSCSVTGDISLCPVIEFVQVHVSNDISGSIIGCTVLEVLYILAVGSTITIPNVTNVTKIGYIYVNGLVLTSANVNQILADVWANRDVGSRTYATRKLYLNNAGSGPPTGQGIIDKTNLEAYRSPNNDPGYNLWEIFVVV